MLELLIGTDDFTKNEYVTQKILEHKAEKEFFAIESLKQAGAMLEQSLFGGLKVYILEAQVNWLSDNVLVEKLANSKNIILFLESKLDKRLSQTKALLSNKNILVKNFEVPVGQELENWIMERVVSLGGKIAKSATKILAENFVGQSNPYASKYEKQAEFSLWAVDSEIKKLLAYVGQQEITEKQVLELSSSKVETNSLEIANAISTNNQQQVFNLLEKYFSESGKDTKTPVLQLSALLGEQFRSMLTLMLLKEQGKTDKQLEILTGWKSGRVFMVSKASEHFPKAKILSFLQKLGSLDEEIKQTSTPPRVILELIISQLF